MTTLLLIEDAIDLAHMIVSEFESNGYRTLHAADGKKGIQAFQQEQPDLVILDWMLPELDGLEVLRCIRQVSAIPVLMLTARQDEVDRVIGLEVGADDYLTKPFGMRELLARVRALLRRIENAQAILNADRNHSVVSVSYENLHLDPSAYLARLDGVQLDLTRIEFNLLCLLARNPGRTFSRNYLLETVWGETYIDGDRSVDNAILRLRKKLGALDEAIETVWGIGYRFKRVNKGK
jgi:DNA-binding response OmpR family regulator